MSWTAPGSIVMCGIMQYNVTLSSANINKIISYCTMSSHNFTGLLDDTLFTVTVTRIKIKCVGIPDSISVRTPICISGYICICTYIRTYM